MGNRRIPQREDNTAKYRKASAKKSNSLELWDPIEDVDELLDPQGFDDDFDDFDEPLLRGTKQSRIRPRIIVMLSLIVAVLIVGGVYLYVSEQARIAEEQAAIALAEEAALRQQQLEKENRYNSILSGTVFLPGVSVEGVDIGGKTRSEAIAALQPLLDSMIPKGTLPLQFEEQSFSFDLSLLNVTSNLDSVLDEALLLAASDDMENSLAMADEIAANGRGYTLTVQHDFDSITQFVAELAAQINTPMKNASIGTIDTENHTVTLSDSVAGIAVQESELVTRINNAILNNTLGAIEIPFDRIEPTISSDQLTMISVSAETSFKGSSNNRIYNIKKGAGKINGTVLAPGEEFSTNAVLGTRTSGNGWKLANAYVGGTTEEQAGGGVCQLSSTLYNAVVKADLEVTARRNHSMPVSYIRNGLDATINSVGNIIDFKFKNNTDCDLVVFSWTSGKTVYFKIIRCAFDTDEYDEIRLTSEKIKTLYPDGEMEIIEDPTLAPGTEEIDVPTQNGSVYQSYKVYYKNGTRIRSEALARSTYKAFNGSKRVGPEPSPSPSPSPSPEITATPMPTPGTETPTPTPESTPTAPPEPTQAPTQEPTQAPPQEPTQEPTPTDSSGGGSSDLPDAPTGG